MPRLFRCLSRRSLRFLHALGGAAGWLTWLASPSYRRRLHANASLAGISAEQRRAAVAEAGRLVFELPRLWLRAPEAPIPDPLRWEGAELLEGSLGHPGGLILLTPHMGSFEMAGQAIAERFGARQPMTVLYRPARQAWLRELEATARARPGMATAPANLAGVRQMMRALRRGETVGLLPDQVPPDGQGVWAPFFGQPAYTMTLAARLAQQTGARVLTLWCERLPRGSGYVVRISELAVALPTLPGRHAATPGATNGSRAINGSAASTASTASAVSTAGTSESISNVSKAQNPVEASADTVAAQDAATAINRSMEALILQHPGQYLWGYHRYKTPRPQA